MRAEPGRVPRVLSLVLVLGAFGLGACLPVTRPVVKIGLAGPFEGRYREVGYEVIYAVRLAVREANAARGAGGYSVELAALDDGGDPALAEEQARKLASDPAVVVAFGHWLEATTLAAALVYAEAGLPYLATTAAALPEASFRMWPDAAALSAASAGLDAAACPAPCDTLDDLGWLVEQRADNPEEDVIGPPAWGQLQFAALAGTAAEGARFVAPAPLPADSTDPQFADRYRAISGGVDPRFYAVLAYDATRLMLQAITVAASDGPPTRASVEAALAEVSLTGLSGALAFDAERDWEAARGWVYRWEDGKVTVNR